MARTDPQINIRIPEEIRRKLDKAMAKSGNSLTAEIVARLEQSFDDESNHALLKEAYVQTRKLLHSQGAMLDLYQHGFDKFRRDDVSSAEIGAALVAAKDAANEVAILAVSIAKKMGIDYKTLWKDR